MSSWYDLEQYRRQELDYCLKLAGGHTEQTSDFYARYGLALSYHHLYLDAVNLVAECRSTPQYKGVIDLVNNMANGELPSDELEYPENLRAIVNETIRSYLRKKALEMYKSYKRLPLTRAREIIGNLDVLDGLYEQSGDFLEALPQTNLTYQPNTTREIDLLSEASAELQKISQEKSAARIHIRRPPDQMEVE